MQALKKLLKLDWTLGYKLVFLGDEEFKVYQNGTAFFRNGTLAATDGLKEITEQYRKQPPHKVFFTFNEYTFTVHENGSSHFANGTLVLEKGGIKALKEWCIDHLLQKYTKITVEGVDYFLTRDNKVLDAEGTVITENGEQGLKEYLLRNEYSLIELHGVNYRVFGNGTVTTADGELISETGGTEALHTYVEERYAPKY